MRKKIKINTDSIVLIISVLSLIWIILYRLVFINYRAPSKFIYELGYIFFGVMASIVASGIFYYFVVYLEKKRKKRVINKIVNLRLRSFGVSFFIIKQDTFSIFGLDESEPLPSVEKFIQVCKGIDLRGNAPAIPNVTFKPISWYEYFYNFFGSDKHNIKRLHKHIDSLDIELIEILDKLEYSYFERGLDSYRENNMNHTIQGIAGPFWEYLKNLEELSNYNKSKFS